MAINPVVFTEKVVGSFLRYQLTAYPFSDKHLHDQMRRLLSLDETRDSPLLQGPYISLSRSFRQGAAVDDLITEGVFHPHMRQRVPGEITHLYGHQERAIRSIHAGHTTLVSTGTGSGKSECFLYPIVSTCLRLRDEQAASGICAVIVYPMNALAEDQLGRLRSLLAGTGISFGMYVGKTPENEAGVTGIRLPKGSTRADYDAKLQELRDQGRTETVHPFEEACSREAMRTPGGQPRILLTNVKQLELLLTRQKDVELFANARLDYLVFDEAHTFTGAQGAETACLIRRLRAFCGRGAADTVCVATSATIVDVNNPDAARQFASRFFGVQADKVQAVGETYEPHVWAEGREVPPAPEGDLPALLRECVTAIDDADPASAVRKVFKNLSGENLSPGDWQEALHEALSRNELVYRVSELLATPRVLTDIVTEIGELVGRHVSEEELLCWLTLGAAARVDGRPLLRPVVHGFIRGISGAVATFPVGEARPRLWLAAEDELDSGDTEHAHFPLTTCTTCGQHYFVTFLKDFEFSGKYPGGGDAVGDSYYWERLEETHGGKRVVLTDQIIGETDDEAINESSRTAKLYFCRRCGAAHPEVFTACKGCGDPGEPRLLYAIQAKADNPGYLSSCLSCRANGSRYGSRYREPARPVRATNVADVHVLAQDMLNHAERRRLLVFCDNRQDAAFQAGWMKDHSRRFRIRAIMAGIIRGGAGSIGDIALRLDELLDQDETMSRALIPEVWQVKRREGSGGEHERLRKKFLRIQVLREITSSSRQSIGLEPWGRIHVEYEGLDTTAEFIRSVAAELGLSAEDLRDGVASLLDYFRRRRVLFDPEHRIFSKYWQDGSLEVQQGFLPQMGNPIGTKLTRAPTEKSALVIQWLSKGGETTVRQLARKWGVPDERRDSFLEKLFEFLKEKGLLVPVQLLGAKGNPLPNLSDLWQVNADAIRIGEHHGVWQCQSCRRRMTRCTPYQQCPAWRCEGQLELVSEDPENYDLQLLDQNYSMLRPEEHTAMVPHAERERIENLFKGESEAVNTLVCTPTLELGVDIGSLDAILMRNVPPLPANYWQRAGRAGRRHRMAVDLTYCRPVSHDRAYFADPLKMLSGRVDPPAFNLSNDLMIAKHVRAAVITRLFQIARDQSRPESERDQIEKTLGVMLPARVGAYLFLDDQIREDLFDVSPLRELIRGHMDDLLASVAGVFSEGWPERDADFTTPEVLREHVAGMTDALEGVIRSLRKRLNWARQQINRLNEVRSRAGTLDPEDDATFRRCDRMIKRLKGSDKRRRIEAEGYNDVNTYGVLAAEGFLPGYGLETGSVLATAEIPFWRSNAQEFYLPRPPSVALREYVPGNLIYANSNRFVARRFHRDVEERQEMPHFEVSMERQAIKETNAGSASGGLGSSVIRAMSVCDVDLVHQSHISDEEETRFQMGVSVFGRERGQHGKGTAFLWGGQSVQFRKAVQFRLVNVGASISIERFRRFGYPVCTVCGQSVSPLSSDKQRDHFEEDHADRCGRKIDPVGFFADITADALSLPACEDRTVAYSICESLRMASARVLDMHVDDLQVLVIGDVGRDDVDAVLWDPMPGGSGLVEQMCDRFKEIVAAALEVVDTCPSACGTSCIDCLQSYRNSFYHKYLDRNVVRERLQEWGGQLQKSHEILAQQPAAEPTEESHPVNEAERKLRQLLLAAGFGEGLRGQQIRLSNAIGTTTPDVIFRGDHDDDDEGVCVYLDGLSAHLHGNPATAEKDREIRSWLRGHGYEVLEIAASDLDDQARMVRHFRKLAGYLQDTERRDSVKRDTTWFQQAMSDYSDG